MQRSAGRCTDRSAYGDPLKYGSSIADDHCESIGAIGRRPTLHADCPGATADRCDTNRECRLEPALTSTAELQGTVNAEFARRLRSTYAAGLTQTQDALELGLRFHIPTSWTVSTKYRFRFASDANVTDIVDRASKLGSVHLTAGQIAFELEPKPIRNSYFVTPNTNGLSNATSTPFGADILSSLIQPLKNVDPGIQLSPPTFVSIGIFKGAVLIATIDNTPFQALIYLLNWQDSYSAVLAVYVAPGELDADRPLIDAILSRAENISPTPTVTKAPTITPTATATINPAAFDMSTAKLFKAPNDVIEIMVPNSWQNPPSQRPNTYDFRYGDPQNRALPLLEVRISPAEEIYTFFDKTGSANSPETAIAGLVRNSTNPQLEPVMHFQVSAQDRSK